MSYGLRFALVLTALAVIFGAFGAHAIRDAVSPESYQSYQTGILYHFLHSFGIILIALIVYAGWMDPLKGKWVVRLFGTGILLFSGSIYLLATREISGFDWARLAGPLTPIGGVCFIAGWILSAISVKLPVLRD